jgi:hypothetical protein
MAENKLNVKKDETVFLSSNDGCYSIRKFDWNRVRRKLTTTKNKKTTDFKLIYSILYGVAGSAGLSTIPVLYATGLPNWVIPLYILTAIFSLGVAITLTIINKNNVENNKVDLNEIETEMNEIEKMFEQPE